MASFQSQSSQMPQYPGGFGSLFLKSQFCAPVDKIPADLNLQGKTAVITGANTGIGLECAKQLLRRGLAALVVTARSQAKADATLHQLQQVASSKQTVQTWVLDMDSYDSIQGFADHCSTLPRIDYVILNAGMTALEFGVNALTGHENVYQINYLSTMLLTILLLPVMKAQKDTSKTVRRIIIVNSGAAMHGSFPQANEPSIFKALDDPNTFSASNSYKLAKFLSHLFIDKLSRVVSPQDVVINMVDPGLVKGTDLHADLGFVFRSIFGLIKAATGRRLEDAAATYIDAAVVKGPESHGCFIMNCKISPYRELYYAANREQTQEKLWRETMAEFEFANAEGIVKSFR